jgi:stringent starvation protein B
MSSATTKPYLLRAIHDWCVDSGFTPHLAVIVDDSVVVPPGYARDGQIVLNIGADATANLELGNEAVTFQARFGGVSQHLYIPVSHVLAIYARENGQGMAFELDLPAEETELGLVETARPDSDEATDGDVPGEPADVEPDSSGDDEPPRARGGHLKLVK